MRFSHARIAVLIVCWLLLLTRPVAAVVAPPAIDGEVREWSDFGDGEVRLFASADRIYLYVKLDSVTVLQAGTGVSVYLDMDGNSGTGLTRAPIGAEYRWDTAARSGVAFTPTGEVERAIRYTDLDWIAAPVMDSAEFEISLRREDFAATNCAVLVERDGVLVGVAAAPYGNRSATRSVSPERSTHADMRLMAYNVLADGLMSDDASLRARFDDEFRMLQPDVICLTEAYASDAEAVRARIAEVLPEMQYASGDGSLDCRIVSRHPVVFARASTRYHAARVRSADGAIDIMVITAHFTCCDGWERRRQEMRAISGFIARLRSGEWPEVPSDLPVVLAGDLNLVRFDRANFTNFQNTTGLRPLRALHLDRNEDYTWRNDNGTEGYSPGRLDYILSGAGFVALHAFVHESDDPPSDHLPLVADFAIDSDRNGLADGWERAFFGVIGHEGMADEDGDGWRNADEQRLDTDPGNPASLPQLRTRFGAEGGALTVLGHGRGNIGFRLLRSSDLSTWQAVGRWMAGTESLPVEASGRAFYRLVLDE